MYLVQRCKPRTKNYSGEMVSKYMELDYMGSAEFEFGAIPKSIRTLASKTLVQTQFKLTNAKGHKFTIHVLADHNEQGEAIDAIKKYLDGKNGEGCLKEWISLRDIVTENGHRGSDPETFWWVVDERNINFCFSLDPEQCRCFKLAIAKSFEFMEKEKQLA